MYFNLIISTNKILLEDEKKELLSSFKNIIRINSCIFSIRKDGRILNSMIIKEKSVKSCKNLKIFIMKKLKKLGYSPKFENLIKERK